MTPPRVSSRKHKSWIKTCLLDDNVAQGMETIAQWPARQVINPLFSFFYNPDELVKWRAVTAAGVVVTRLAHSHMESARVIMRRLIWNLNDESGGIGWGSPEAMGEIMARHEGLAGEYYQILISYIMPEGNYIEHEMLQRGVLWGLGRLAHERPGLIAPSAALLCPYLTSNDPHIRGLAAWSAALFDCRETNLILKNLKNDHTVVAVYLNTDLTETTIGELIHTSQTSSNRMMT